MFFQYKNVAIIHVDWVTNSYDTVLPHLPFVHVEENPAETFLCSAETADRLSVYFGKIKREIKTENNQTKTKCSLPLLSSLLLKYFWYFPLVGNIEMKQFSLLSSCGVFSLRKKRKRNPLLHVTHASRGTW